MFFNGAWSALLRKGSSSLSSSPESVTPPSSGAATGSVQLSGGLRTVESENEGLFCPRVVGNPAGPAESVSLDEQARLTLMPLRICACLHCGDRSLDLRQSTFQQPYATGGPVSSSSGLDLLRFRWLDECLHQKSAALANCATTMTRRVFFIQTFDFHTPTRVLLFSATSVWDSRMRLQVSAETLLLTYGRCLVGGRPAGRPCQGASFANSSADDSGRDMW